MAVRLRRKALPPPSHSTAWLLPMLQEPVGSRGELDLIQSFSGPQSSGSPVWCIPSGYQADAYRAAVCIDPAPKRLTVHRVKKAADGTDGLRSFCGEGLAAEVSQ